MTEEQKKVDYFNSRKRELYLSDGSPESQYGSILYNMWLEFLFDCAYEMPLAWSDFRDRASKRLSFLDEQIEKEMSNW